MRTLLNENLVFELKWDSHLGEFNVRAFPGQELWSPVWWLPSTSGSSCKLFFFSSVHVGHTASKKSEGLLLMPPMGLQQIPQQGVRVILHHHEEIREKLAVAEEKWLLNQDKEHQGSSSGSCGCSQLQWIKSSDRSTWVNGMESHNTVLTWTLRVTKAHYLPLWAVAVSAVEGQQTEQRGTQCGSWQDSNLEHFCHINSSASHSSFASSSISK